MSRIDRPAVLALPPLAALLFALALAPKPAGAQAGAFSKPDSGRLVVYTDGREVGSEDFSFQQHGDSLVVTATARRAARGRDGSIHKFRKSMGLVAGAGDFALVSYLSQQDFDGHTIRRQVIPGDTVLTATIESDERGSADKLPRPPGRVYVLDSGLYTLFDLIGRNLHGRLFGERRIGIVALGDSSITFEATARPAGSDTVRWGNRRVVAPKLRIEDGENVFTLWTSPTGQMLRLENADHQLAVTREPPAAPTAPTPKRARPKPR
jgi:hypothetical protein